MICQGCVKKEKNSQEKKVGIVHPEIAFLKWQANNLTLFSEKPGAYYCITLAHAQKSVGMQGKKQ